MVRGWSVSPGSLHARWQARASEFDPSYGQLADEMARDGAEARRFGDALDR